MSKNRIYWLVSSLFFCLALVTFYFFNFYNKELLSTYFSYNTKEVEYLRKLTSSLEISKQALEDWDEATANLIRQNKLGDKDVSRIYAYLYTAQTDVAFLSYNAKGKMMGSISPISSKVLKLFFPNDIKSIADLAQTSAKTSDEYTSHLTNLVYEKIKKRWESDIKQTHLYSENNSPYHWIGKKPYFGQDVGSWKTWYLQKGDQFRAPPPPQVNTQEWEAQLKITKDALKNITAEQKIAVVHWAGGPGTMTPPGQWLILANTYMSSHDVPLKKMLEVRAVLARAIAESVIAVFDSKYTYWIKRPNMLDTTIQTVMPTPNHPSYPAGHSTISASAATILNFYFPKEKQLWNKHETIASHSRVWGGIHFSIDAQAGAVLGKKVAEEVLKKEASPGFKHDTSQ